MESNQILQLYLCLLKPCRNLAIGKKIHEHIISSRTEWNVKLQTSLLNMYSKCGSMDDARSVFDSMEVRDVISWNAMIGGYAQNGNGKEALELFKQMEQEGIQPNNVTFVVILNACSHAGLVDEALHYFNVMKDRYQIVPDVIHYNCLVDTLSRAGRLEEAENLIRTMKQPNVVTWMALLGACRWNSDIERAERAAENALKLDPQDASVYVLLANIYAVAGRWDDEKEVRLRMERNGIKKIPGQTYYKFSCWTGMRSSTGDRRPVDVAVPCGRRFLSAVGSED